MSALLDRLRQADRPESPRLANVSGWRLAQERLTATIQGYYGTSQLLVTLSDGTRGVIDIGESFRLWKELMRFLKTHEPEQMIGGVISARARPEGWHEWIFNPKKRKT